MKHLARLIVAAAVAVAGQVVTISPSSAAVATTPLSFGVDERVQPAVALVEPAEGNRDPRPVGAMMLPNGSTVELVTGELIVHTRDQAELDGFLQRWNGQIIDSFPADADGQDHLIKVDPSLANPATVAEDLLVSEPRQSGAYRVSDDATLRLLSIAAAEWKLGTEVVIDWLTEPHSIESGNVSEAADLPANVFDWSFMRAGGTHDTGVAAAWQLLQTKGKLTPQIRYMVVDGGFKGNPDFPSNATIRKTSWGDTNAMKCGGNPCPWHGTDVILSGIGRVGNNYGTAGPGGPVTDTVIAVGNSLDYWSIMRRTEKMAEEEDPDVVNMSFGRSVNVGVWHARTWTDRRMKHVRDTGALIVASAGNSGVSVDSDTLVIPCESTHVMCVGGYGDTTARHPNSNYGQGDSTTSVEIYAKYCLKSIADPADPYNNLATRTACGTSFSSPFVGGVAALVMAANPALTSAQVRDILNDTAHVGGLGAEVTGSQRRVNALGAVAKALGVQITNPIVNIEQPTANKEVQLGHWVDLKGTAKDFMGRDVDIKWTSNLDGNIGTGTWTGTDSLEAGTHLITATATDSTGRVGTDTVTIKVIDTPAQVQLISPQVGLNTYAGTLVPLTAQTLDPDTNAPVPNVQTAWEIRRNGVIVHTAIGHNADLPASKALAGSYTAKFTAAGVSAQRSFTIKAVPAGQNAPTATITKPATNITVQSLHGDPVSVQFTGSGTDVQDGAIAGTRYRWTAHSGSESRVLCEGSNVPGSGNGGIVFPKNCANFTGQLTLANGDLATTTWTVVLEVFDSAGLVGTDSVNVTVNLVIL
ncbi:S8 family peptidase [Catelliglobosispora koreensis]|uniref:S8 family peptidase n=1 Tax=Catelliglobosispora koreensis TaxID=129052 RepID=UPI00037E1E1F|nr:S8/S53 family peptidase [Catelliglobosispora koreensis]